MRTFKNLFFVFILFLTTIATAQEPDEPDTTRRHEIKIDAIELIAAGNFEVSYEYLISKFSGAGVSISFDVADGEDVLNWAITPFYRQYFFNKKEAFARGLFAEGHLNLGNFEDDRYYYECYECNTPQTKDNFTALGAGFALGYKWASGNGFVIEPSLGIGRNLFLKQDEYYYDIEVYFRGGILVGYRF